MCWEVDYWSCFSLSTCPHFFHGPCLRPWFGEIPPDKHVTCPSCRKPHVTKSMPGQAQILADIQRRNDQAQNRVNREEVKWSRLEGHMDRYNERQYIVFVLRCQMMVRQFLARKHFIKVRCKMVLCQTIVRQCLAKLTVQMQRYCKNDHDAVRIVAKVIICQAAARR